MERKRTNQPEAPSKWHRLTDKIAKHCLGCVGYKIVQGPDGDTLWTCRLYRDYHLQRYSDCESLRETKP